MKKIWVFLVFLLLIQIASAEEVMLQKGKTYLYKIYPMDLISIGTSGSIHIKINQVDQLVSYGSSTEIYGLIITLLDSSIDTQTAKIDINQTAECLIDADCNDDTACAKNYCELRKCKYEKQSGCALNNECKPKGSLGLISNALSYCDGSSWHSRKQIKESCKENYECLTNYCEKNYCKSLGYLKGGEKMAPAWILIIFGVLIGIFGLLYLIIPKHSKIILINILKLIPNKTLRIIGIILIAVSITLIIWTLI